MRKIITSVGVAFVMSVLPLLAQADIVSLDAVPSSGVVASPLSCFDLRNTLKMGSTGYEVRGLQYDLIQQGLTIPVSEYGTFGSNTLSAVNVFQLRYADELLGGGSTPTGFVGKMTRAKLNSLYGCGSVTVNSSSGKIVSEPTSIILNVKNIALDSAGVTGVFCNKSSSDLPSFPMRIRLNGIIRDFNILGALKAGSCDTDTVPYGAWGLTYDSGTTYSVVTSIDPNGIYKKAQVTYPLTGTTTLSIPAVQGAHLSVRGIAIKTNGLQGTLCNLGTTDLGSYPVRVTVNGTSKDIDVAGARIHGQCQTVIWPFENYGVNGTPGTIITATINVDPNNTIVETNEFDNSATIVGSI